MTAMTAMTAMASVAAPVLFAAATVVATGLVVTARRGRQRVLDPWSAVGTDVWDALPVGCPVLIGPPGRLAGSGLRLTGAVRVVPHRCRPRFLEALRPRLTPEDNTPLGYQSR